MGNSEPKTESSTGGASPLGGKAKSKPAMIWDFLKVRKKWWLMPIIIFTLLVSALIVLAEGSAVTPFIYTLF